MTMYTRNIFRRHFMWLYLLWVFAVIAVIIGQISYSKQWATEKLDREGFTEVTMTGWQPLSLWCGSREGIAQGFRGLDARGKQRSGYVCTNFFYSYIVD